MKYTKEQIMQIVEEEDVEFIRMQFTDIFGTLKNIAITASQLEKALNNEIMFDGSSIDGFASVESSDMYLYPDLDTFEIFPWRPQQGKVARLICNIYKPDRTPFEGDPRLVLKKVLAEAESQGYQFRVGPELEFFLFHTDDNGAPTTITHEKAGYFDVSPIDMGENARRDMVLTLEEMDFEIESSHHEVAPAQHEIDFSPEDAMSIADKIVTFKLAVKSIAKRHGLHATFMPKPKENECGSGMHINMALYKNGQNVFFDANDPEGISKEARWFIAGIMEHIKGMTLITNPLINSYKRLVSGYEAPVYITWSVKNRTPLIRAFRKEKDSVRLELRSPDPAANPYLALAACLAAGLDGMNKQLEPPAPIIGDVFKQIDEYEIEVEKLPESMHSAIREFKQDEVIKDVIGDHIYQHYLKGKYAEWDEYRKNVSQWEVDKYLYRY